MIYTIDFDETASCIKIFILVEYYNQILKGLKSRDDLIKYNKESDYVENGSGLIQYLDNLTITSKNMAILMMIVSDNIATNKIIDYLGFNNINNTIEQLGFKNTKLEYDYLYKMYDEPSQISKQKIFLRDKRNLVKKPKK